MNAAAETETKTLDIDVGGWPTCSGASATLYLRPAAERDCGRPLVYSFGHVGSGMPEAAFNGRELYLGVVGVDTSEESLRNWLEAQTEKLIAFSDAYEGAEWDGHNHIGRWGVSADAREAFEHSLEEASACGEVATYWDASDYFEPVSHEMLSTVISDGIDAVVDSEIEYAQAHGALLREEDVRGYFEELVRQALEEADDPDPYGESSGDRVRRDQLRAILGEHPRKIDIEDAVFHTPRSYNGQSIECSYAGCESGIVLRIIDRSQAPGSAARITYYLAPLEDVENPAFQPWNDEEPELVEGGKWVDVVPQETP